MKVFDLFSKRLKDEQKVSNVEVYEYDKIPENVLFQIALILTDVIGKYWIPKSNALW